MKNLSQTFRRIHSALEFANVGNLSSLETLLEKRDCDNAAIQSAPPAASNVYYIPLTNRVQGNHAGESPWGPTPSV